MLPNEAELRKPLCVGDLVTKSWPNECINCPIYKFAIEVTKEIVGEKAMEKKRGSPKPVTIMRRIFLTQEPTGIDPENVQNPGEIRQLLRQQFAQHIIGETKQTVENVADDQGIYLKQCPFYQLNLRRQE